MSSTKSERIEHDAARLHERPQQTSSPLLASIIPSRPTTMVDGSSDLNAAFKHKAAYMKSWKPASTPSVGGTKDEKHSSSFAPKSLVSLTVSSLFSTNRTATAWNSTHSINKPCRGMLPPVLKRRRLPNVPSTMLGVPKAASTRPKRCDCTFKSRIDKCVCMV